MTSSARDRLLALLRERSFARRPVKLASGRESDFFVDCKQTALLAEGHALVGEVLFEEVAHHCSVWPSAVAGVELGGCPLASAVALVSHQRGRPLDGVYVRKDIKDHGSKRALEGTDGLGPGAAIVLLEDVVTTGGSTLRAAGALRDAGFQVALVVALVDRCEGGADALAAAGLPFRALYTRADFIPPE